MPGAPRRVWGLAPPALPAALGPPLGSFQEGWAPALPAALHRGACSDLSPQKHSSNSLGQKMSLLRARQDLIKPSTRTVEPEIRVVKGGETAIEDRGPAALQANGQVPAQLPTSSDLERGRCRVPAP